MENNTNEKSVKKHSNKKTAFIVLVPFILFCLAYIIISGGWNPFKDQEISESAKAAYDTAYDVPSQLWKDLNPEDEELDTNTPYYRQLQAEFGPNGDTPYGFEILEDNGKDTKEAVLKALRTSSGSYNSTYGMDYDVYYMRNEDYAKEKYIQLKNGDEGIKDFKKEYDIPNGKLMIKEGDPGLVLYYVRINTVVYSFDAFTEMYSPSKGQPLFDKLGIDFKLLEFSQMK